jgi:hypothetical protein
MHSLRPQGPPWACRRLPPTPRRRGLARGKGTNPRAWPGSGLGGRSRLLESPIQNRAAETGHLRRTRPAHAPLHNDVGGYMKGEGKKEKWAGASAIAATATVRRVPCKWAL